MEGGAGDSGGGLVCQYWNGIIGVNMGTIEVDKVKWIGGPWLKYRVGVAWGGEFAENITGSKRQQKLLVPQPYMGINRWLPYFLSGNDNLRLYCENWIIIITPNFLYNI